MLIDHEDSGRSPQESAVRGEQSEPGLPDVWWFRLDGRRMTRRDWENPDHRSLGVFLNGQATGAREMYVAKPYLPSDICTAVRRMIAG